MRLVLIQLFVFLSTEDEYPAGVGLQPCLIMTSRSTIVFKMGRSDFEGALTSEVSAQKCRKQIILYDFIEILKRCHDNYINNHNVIQFNLLDKFIYLF